MRTTLYRIIQSDSQRYFS